MPKFKWTRLVYVNETDKNQFVRDYKQWKKGTFFAKDIFTTNKVEKEIKSGDEEAHEFLDLEHVVTDVFNKLDKPGKKNMFEVCKCWAKWFIIGTDTSKVSRDYNSQLARENDGSMIWLYREDKLVQRFCAFNYRDTDKESEHFTKDWRKYERPKRGQIYHNVPKLLPDNRKPKYLQLYFYDGQYEALNRIGCFPEVIGVIVNTLIQITHNNPYARFFRSLRELPINDNSQIRIHRNTVLDQRVYNAPTSDEVAIIWTDNSSSSESNTPHITVTAKDNQSHRIMHYYGCYDPLQYPLLFPYGECGWVQGLQKLNPQAAQKGTNAYNRVPSELSQTVECLLEDESNRVVQIYGPKSKIVSYRRYYCYKLQSRPGNMLLRTGRCFQQYVVDMYVKIENTRLDYFRNNQETIRVELYQGILDTIGAGEHRAANIGKRVILPPSFLGGPGDIKKRYLNSKALVHRFGKQHLFITKTCNANWPEIKDQLAPGEEAQNRPDLVARVFRAKLLALKKQIVEKQIFQEVAVYVYVVEFQKRGLPQVHFLIILKDGYRLKCPADFDKFVSAEIPSMANPSLRKSVLKHIMHGPCGNLNPTCSYMKHPNTLRHCKFNYPKPYTSDTIINVSGYLDYRRRNTRETVVVRKHNMDNRWVIPYNPYLLALFDCHLKVEVCSTMHAMKYLYKYIYKGHDRVSFSLAEGEEPQAVVDIFQYQTGRWLSPCEAAWRIFGFDLFETQPPVMPLQVHLQTCRQYD
ncbi:uncharacterized protein LOC141630318 [Silene latifolia]|uniref:uncharacterized protein LOC141630318 n=1 Tax=Silene latifolia TaxID=37657 RepID=UPI003D76E6F6